MEIVVHYSPAEVEKCVKPREAAKKLHRKLILLEGRKGRKVSKQSRKKEKKGNDKGRKEERWTKKEHGWKEKEKRTEDGKKI